MKSSAALAIEERPSRYDSLMIRLAFTPRLRFHFSWIVPALITLLAGILRFTNLAQPHELVFDETYYVKDAWTQWQLGYPSNWPEDPNDRFESGEIDFYTRDGSFVVHPPLGKFLIGIGLALFGADSSFGWRFSVALFGTATVLVLHLTALSLSRSLTFAAIASTLMAVDGLAIVMSRVALLDIFLTFFVLLGFWFILRDRRRSFARLSGPPPGKAHVGPMLWNRPWLIAAGASFGAATAVKWSGMYVLAAFGLYVVITDALHRRRGGDVNWIESSLRQGGVSFLLYVPAACAVYLVSWIGWLDSSGGYSRDAANSVDAGFWGGGWIPAALRSLWIYHKAIYAFHIGVNTEHPYASPAWQWPLLLRPTAMHFTSSEGCGSDAGCHQVISSMPNPLIWWAAVAAALYLVYRFARDRRWPDAVILTALAATYLPWLAYPDRTMFQFYTIVMLPFLLLALTTTLRDIASPPQASVDRRKAGQRVVLVFMVVVIALSAWWYPVLVAMDVSDQFWRMHGWLRSWVS